MKKFKIAAVTVGMLFAASAANAADGTIEFNGKVISETCVIHPDDVNKIVQLPTVSAQAFKRVGEVTGTQRFDIRVSNCPASMTNVAVHLESVGNNSGINMVTGNLRNDATTNPATNIEVSVFDKDDGSQLRPAETGRYYALTGTGAARGAVMTYVGAYYPTQLPVVAGEVHAKVAYTLAYK
nr:fimbrial protein [uncultured Moellerella sp.]